MRRFMFRLMMLLPSINGLKFLSLHWKGVDFWDTQIHDEVYHPWGGRWESISSWGFGKTLKEMRQYLQDAAKYQEWLAADHRRTCTDVSMECGECARLDGKCIPRCGSNKTPCDEEFRPCSCWCHEPPF